MAISSESISQHFGNIINGMEVQESVLQLTDWINGANSQTLKKFQPTVLRVIIDAFREKGQEIARHYTGDPNNLTKVRETANRIYKQQQKERFKNLLLSNINSAVKNKFVVRLLSIAVSYLLGVIITSFTTSTQDSADTVFTKVSFWFQTGVFLTCFLLITGYYYPTNFCGCFETQALFLKIIARERSRIQSHRSSIITSYH